jgi:hypothetical protein
VEPLESGSERQEENGVQQLFRLRHPSNEFKVTDGLPDGQLQLVTVYYSGERDPALLRSLASTSRSSS